MLKLKALEVTTRIPIDIGMTMTTLYVGSK